LKITGLIHYRLTPGVLITELLAGENFFEILWHEGRFILSGNTSFTFIKFVIFLYIEIVLIFFVLCATAHYTLKQSNSIRKSTLASLSHWRGICVWGLIELFAQGSSSFLGSVGTLLYFAWNLMTIFDIQILSFDRFSVYHMLKKSWKLFTQTFSEIVALDIIIEGFLIIIGLGIYIVSKQYISGISIIGTENYNDIVVFLILYLISSVMIFEAVVFTKLYKKIEIDKNL
jgi:hypothetical protein